MPNNLAFAVLLGGLVLAGPLAAPSRAGDSSRPAAPLKAAGASAPVAVKPVTFIELGSVKCIPCRMMQPVMKEIEQDYGTRVKVIFYDVWTRDGRPYAEHYKIRAIPTQVFLDPNGVEFFRHTGFFSKAEIVKVLSEQGVK